ncbi:hypothetical protein AB1E18_007650 [Capra hircus]
MASRNHKIQSAPIKNGREDLQKKLPAQRGGVLRPVRVGALEPVSQIAARRNLEPVEPTRNLEPRRPRRQYRFLSGGPLQ